jgi:hypothetical protein
MIGQRTGEACAVAGSKVLILESLSIAQVLWGQYVIAETCTANAEAQWRKLEGTVTRSPAAVKSPQCFFSSFRPEHHARNNQPSRDNFMSRTRSS